MIPFHCRLRDKTRTPIIRNEDIWAYAEALAGDYKPSLLKEPGQISAEHFLESYLGATLDYQDIYYAKDERPVAGATVFNDEMIRVFDREGQCTRTISVPAGTIIIDNSTVSSKYKGFALFTALHEGGHFAMHPEVYRRSQRQVSLFAARQTGSGLVCCRREAIFGERPYSRNLTPEQNREHQANAFAAFVAMPRQTFVPLATELIKNEYFSDGILAYDDRDWECQHSRDRV